MIQLKAALDKLRETKSSDHEAAAENAEAEEDEPVSQPVDLVSAAITAE